MVSFNVLSLLFIHEKIAQNIKFDVLKNYLYNFHAAEEQKNIYKWMTYK